MLQAVIDFIVGLVAAIAATALAQFGIDVDTARQSDREIRRVADCAEQTSQAVVKAPSQNC